VQQAWFRIPCQGEVVSEATNSLPDRRIFGAVVNRRADALTTTSIPPSTLPSKFAWCGEKCNVH
jgi:hypothetical protein